MAIAEKHCDNGSHSTGGKWKMTEIWCCRRSAKLHSYCWSGTLVERASYFPPQKVSGNALLINEVRQLRCCLGPICEDMDSTTGANRIQDTDAGIPSCVIDFLRVVLRIREYLQHEACGVHNAVLPYSTVECSTWQCNGEYRFGECCISQGT